MKKFLILALMVLLSDAYADAHECGDGDAACKVIEGRWGETDPDTGKTVWDEAGDFSRDNPNTRVELRIRKGRIGDLDLSVKAWHLTTPITTGKNWSVFGPGREYKISSALKNILITVPAGSTVFIQDMGFGPGGIGAEVSGKFVATNVNFELLNNSDNGAALRCVDGSTCELTGAHFRDNHTNGSGAAIYCGPGSHCTCTDCFFEGNHADVNGGDFSCQQGATCDFYRPVSKNASAGIWGCNGDGNGANITMWGGSSTQDQPLCEVVRYEFPAGTVRWRGHYMTTGLNNDGIDCTGDCVLSNTVVNEPLLVLDMEFIDDTVLQGDTATLRFTIRNQSMGSNATGITFVGLIDPQLGPMSISDPSALSPCGADSNIEIDNTSPDLELTGGDLGFGESCSFEVFVDVRLTTPPGIYDNETSGFKAMIGGSTIYFDNDQNGLRVEPVLLINKEFTDDPVQAGDTVNLRFTLTNQSLNDNATSISFKDDLDQVLSDLKIIAPFPLNTGSCDGRLDNSEGNRLTYRFGSLLASQSCVFSFTLSVPGSTLPGLYINRTFDEEVFISGIKVPTNSAMDRLRVSSPPSVKASGKPTALAATPTTNPSSVGTGTLASDANPGSSTESQCNDFGSSAFTSQGFNMDSNGSCFLNQPSDLPNTNPLVVVDANGIPQPQPGSPVIESGPVDFVNNELPCLYKDLNGLGRPQDFDLDGVFACDRGPVEVQGGLDIGAPQSAAFYDTGRDGEGAFVEILEDGRAVVSFYSYTQNGTGLVWFTGLGRVVGNSVVIDEMLRVTGGVFGADFDPDTIVRTPVGGMSLVFPDCDAIANPGRLNFTARNDSGFENLLTKASRLTSIVNCDGTPAAANAHRSGGFYAPDRSGEGIFVQWLSDGRVAFVFYTFDNEGNPFWMINSDTVVNGDTVTATMVYAEGKTKFGANFNPAEVNLVPWGTITLTYSDDDNLTFDYNSTLAGFGAGNHAYTRLTTLAGTGVMAQGN